MLSIYPACFFKEADNKYSVIFPDLNWLSTCGDSIEDALSMAVDCLAGYLYTCQKNNENVPAPSSIKDISLDTIATELQLDSLQGFVNMVSVDVPAYAKEHFERSVKKTLTIPAWLNKAALEQGINFSQVLQEALIAKIKA
ncbi:type II toxin-antitoxin system HicB family antitoxin [Ruminococcus sp. 5_1_39BFAA]|uniref:type II toxin-antitoxin system HicB family antitoxin n=1 Tax=Ruminococcus sp. 5_1_39BFAA TaxID=457412 RepID=UPI003565CA28